MTIEYVRGERLFLVELPNWKRAVDIVGSSVGIMLFAPVMAIVAVAIKLTSPGPVLFRQMRTGSGGRRFTFYKFRSMVTDAEFRKRELMCHNHRQGPVFKMANDPRVTPLGRFIRKWSLDELPQLFNVLGGAMSLVGPRPLPHDESARQDGWHNRRLDVTPGITGLWQVSARDDDSFDHWVRLDIEYIKKRSLALDLRILVRTLPAVLSRKGAE